MCDQCGEIEDSIARYKRLKYQINDKQTKDAVDCPICRTAGQESNAAPAKALSCFASSDAHQPALRPFSDTQKGD